MPVTVNAAPPRKPQAAKSPDALSKKAQQRAEDISAFGSLLCVPFMATGNLADVGAISLHFPRISVEIARLADDNAKVAEAIDKFTAVGPYAGLIAAVLPLALQVAVNHGRLPAEAGAQFGVTSKDTLESQVRASMLRKEMEAKMILLQEEKAAREAEELYRQWEAEDQAQQNGHLN